MPLKYKNDLIKLSPILVLLLALPVILLFSRSNLNLLQEASSNLLMVIEIDEKSGEVLSIKYTPKEIFLPSDTVSSSNKYTLYYLYAKGKRIYPYNVGTSTYNVIDNPPEISSEKEAKVDVVAFDYTPKQSEANKIYLYRKNNRIYRLSQKDTSLEESENVSILENELYVYDFKNLSNRTKDKTLDLVVLSCGFENDRANHEKYTKYYTSTISMYPFYSDYRDRINIIRYTTPFANSTLGCATNNSGFLRVDDAKVRNIISSSGGDGYVVIMNTGGGINASLSLSAKNIGGTRIGLWTLFTTPKLESTLFHEWGHSIGGVVDEYVYLENKDTRPPSGYNEVNCKTSCSKFDPKYLTEGKCSEGCGRFYGKGAFRTTCTSAMGSGLTVGGGECPPQQRFEYNLLTKDSLVSRVKYFAPDIVTNNDQTKPLLSIVSPKASSSVSKTLNIKATASDLAGIARIYLTLDTNIVKICEKTNECNHSIDIQNYQDGEYILIADAIDNNNNVTSSRITFNITKSAPGPSDTKAPVASIISPANNSTVSGNTNINANASDNIAVTSIDILVDNVKFKNCPANIASASCQSSWNTTLVTNGRHTIQIDAYDSSGNKGSSSISVNVSNGGTTPPPPPSTGEISPTPGSTITLPTTFEWQHNTGNSYTFMIGSAKGVGNYAIAYLATNKYTFEGTSSLKGETIYVRLIRYQGRTATYKDYTYKVQ